MKNGTFEFLKFTILHYSLSEELSTLEEVKEELPPMEQPDDDLCEYLKKIFSSSFSLLSFLSFSHFLSLTLFSPYGPIPIIIYF